MKSLFMALLWRTGIGGLLIAGVGIMTSLAFHNWHIEKWFTILGILCFLLAAISFSPGARASSMRVNMRMKNYAEANRRDMRSSRNFSITMVIIGVINIFVSAFAYHSVK